MSQEVEYYQDKAGEWRWRVQAPNGKIIAESGEGYKNRGDAEHGYGLVIEHGATAADGVEFSDHYTHDEVIEEGEGVMGVTLREDDKDE